MTTISTLPATKGLSNKPSLSSFNNNNNHNQYMDVDKNIVNELLLVCGVIGSTTDPKSQTIVPVTDCLNWLQDLQRALHRDEDAYRPVSLLVGKWNVVPQKLLPLVLSCRYDTQLVITIVKILVILTKPLSPTTIKAGRLIIDAKKGEKDVIREQNKLRENAMAQANMLTEYKRIFVHHPSHRTKQTTSQKSKSTEEERGLLSIFVSLLAEPLSRTGSARTENDHLIIELVLHLLRNLLSAGNEAFGSGSALDSSDRAREAAVLHQGLISLFEKELVLDILLVIGQDMESRENKQYNLLLMEILHHILYNQDPTLVARSVLKYNPAENEKVTNAAFISKSDLSNSLMSKLRNERNKLHTLTASRHSQFGGMLEVKKSLGDKKLLSMSGPHSKGLCSTSLVEMKRKTKKHQYFVASGRTVAAHTRPSAAYSSATHEAGPASIKAQKTLHRFCHRFVTQCYGSVMKSLKNEFRLDSKRLEDGDKVIFFRIVWFFCQWWRVSVSEGNMTSLSSKDESNSTHHGVDPCKSAVGNLIFNMDVFTFNLVLTASDFFYDHKKFKDLAQTVSLYTEMMHLLHLMYTSSDNTEQIMAMGLMDRLFYQSEPIDRLPRLIQRWAPGTFTREYVCELIELTHVTLKLLDAHSVLCEDVKPKEEKKRKRGKKKNLEEEPIDTISRMKAIAAEFDVTSYMARKLISNQTVLMFTQVLSQHHLNAYHINQDIISFFVRLCRFTIASDDNDDFDGLAPNADGKTTTITLEAMLFNLPLFQVLQEILQDKNLHNLKEYERILTFATTIVRHFSEACEKNPLLYVECLFKHNFPHRFCESIANFYVSDELRMIIERDMLLEEHKKLDQHYDEADESDDDEELEFTEDIDRGIQKKQTNISDQTDKSSNDEGVDAVLNDDPSETESNPDDHADDGTSNIITKHDKELALSKDNDNYSTQYDENEMEDENSLNDISISEKEKNDERWNDRRQFIPKRKVNEVTENENTSEDGSPLTKKRHFSNRIRKTVIDESDEDEEEEEQFNSPQELSKHRPTGRILLDDDDDDE